MQVFDDPEPGINKASEYNPNTLWECHRLMGVSSTYGRVIDFATYNYTTYYVLYIMLILLYNISKVVDPQNIRISASQTDSTIVVSGTGGLWFE